MRQRAMPRAPDGTRGGLNLEEEDEKENDRHRWRQQQSQNDPGAKACEATCVFCVGMLFLQVAWIFYTYGVQGTLNLLMAPEVTLGRAPRTSSTYQAMSAPAGYGEEVTVLHDADAGLQRIHYTADGNLRVVLMDAKQRTTHWLFYEPARTGGAASAVLSACYVLANDTTLQYGLLHPRETFSQHSAFKLLSQVPEVTPTPVYDPAKCIPFSRTGEAGLTWGEASWTRPAGPAAPALARGAAASGYSRWLASAHGRWCGASRGGFHDCCDGRACAACTAADGVTAACLSACPPESSVDTACAAHAACVAKSGAEAACGPGGSCACLGQLQDAVKEAKCKDSNCTAYASALGAWLPKEVACWDARQACQSIPCTTDAAAGWCKACGFFKPCRTLEQKPQ